MNIYGPRERSLEKDAASLNDAELLAVALGPGTRRLCDELLESHGSLRQVILASREELEAQKGVGPSRLAALRALREICSRLWQTDAPQKAQKVTTSRDALAVFSDLILEEQEVVAVAMLDGRLRLIRRQIVFRGALDSAPARPREILREALRANAANVVVAHNHPSGDCTPSRADVTFTVELEYAARALGIPLLDHLVLGKGGAYFSFSDARWLTKAKQLRKTRSRRSGPLVGTWRGSPPASSP